jgi:hemolysin III
MTEITNSRYTKKEELASALSHLTGTLLGLVAMVLMIIKSVQLGSGWHITSSAIFGASIVILYFSSTMTHWLNPGKWKEVFFTLDQIAIFLLIAGTYTPLTLVALHGPFGWVIFGLEWGLALTGIIIKLSKPTQFNKGVNLFYILLYASMGWMILIAIVPIFKLVPFMGVIWVLIGGMCYTVGIFFYRKARFKYHHLVWHLLVLAGTISHFIAIYYYVLPLTW